MCPKTDQITLPILFEVLCSAVLDELLQCQQDMSEAVDTLKMMFGEDFQAIGEVIAFSSKNL